MDWILNLFYRKDWIVNKQESNAYYMCYTLLGFFLAKYLIMVIGHNNFDWNIFH